MSDDLERFYEALADDLAEADEDDELAPGMFTSEGELILDDMDIDEEYDEDDEFLDPEDDDEEYSDEDDDENIMGVVLEPEDATSEGDGDGDGEETETGTAFLNLAELLNRAGTSADARSSLLARILAGAGPAAGTRSGGQGLLSSIRQMTTPRAAMTPAQQRAAYAEQRRKEREWWTEQKEPHPSGVALLQSGEFGRVGDWRVPGGKRRPRCAVERRKARTWTPLPSKVRLSSRATGDSGGADETGHAAQLERDHCCPLPFRAVCRAVRGRGLRPLL